MGISRKAFAEPELTKKFSTSTSRKMTTAAPYVPMFDAASEI